jgi:alpha/beta superfamily hydrolase
MSESPAAPASADLPLAIAGPAGRIEAAFDLAEADATPQPVLAIVCHPLPTEGGSMHNKVVTMTARALRESGIDHGALQLPRGRPVRGPFDDGRGELDDLRAWRPGCARAHPDKALWLAGFSFGAWVALRGAVELGAARVDLDRPAGRARLGRSMGWRCLPSRGY